MEKIYQTTVVKTVSVMDRKVLVCDECGSETQVEGGGDGSISWRSGTSYVKLTFGPYDNISKFNCPEKEETTLHYCSNCWRKVKAGLPR